MKILLLDVDGVLTDGTVEWASTGADTKRFHARDRTAIRRFAEEGWEVHLISSSDWVGLRHYAQNLPVRVWADHPKTLEAIRDITHGDAYAACGDDSELDLGLLSLAKSGFCPNDADPGIIEMVVTKFGIDNVLPLPGGAGVVVELARRLL